MSKHYDVVAHRGASGVLPENTIPAFEHAINLGADMLEFDVRLTADGEMVVIHDATVDRTTDGTGAISELTFAQIRELDAGDGANIPTLDELLECAKPSGIQMNVQIYDAGFDLEPLTKGVVAALSDHDYDERAFIASRGEVIRLVKQLDPARPFCNLDGQTDAEESLKQVAAVGGTIVQPFHPIVTPEYVQRAHEMGMRLNVFYADDEDAMRYLMDCGVDGILTNQVELLLKVLGRI